jgi:hypothetical protein
MSKWRAPRADLTRRRLLLQAGAALLAPLAATAQEAKRSYRIGIMTPAPRSSPNYCHSACNFDPLSRGIGVQN